MFMSKHQFVDGLTVYLKTQLFVLVVWTDGCVGGVAACIPDDLRSDGNVADRNVVLRNR